MSTPNQSAFAFDQAEHDITARKHGGNRHSREAHERVKSGKVSMAERLRVHIAACDDYGATIKELCARFGKLPNEISGRLSELKKQGRIFDSNRTRERCAILVNRKEWCALWARPEVRP